MFTLPNTNINFLKVVIDKNGNKVAKFGFANNSKKFSIQTNGNLPSLHKDYTKTVIFSLMEDTKKELYQYLYATNSKLFSIIEDKTPNLFALEQLK